MKYVNIYKLQNDGSQTVIATCRLSNDGTVVCDGNQAFVENLERDGILDYGNPQVRNKLFPKDGIKLLENLKFAFRSGYLVATDIQEQ